MPVNTGPAPDQSDDSAPQFVINPSTIRAMLTTAGSLLLFAVTFATTLLGFVKNHDLANAINYLKSEQTITSLTALIGAGWWIYRIVVARWKKQRDVVIAAAAPDSVAVLSTDIVPPADADSAPSPLRAREPETPVPPAD